MKDIPVPRLGKVEEEVCEKGDVKSKEEEPRFGTPVPSVDVEHVGLQLVHDDTTSNVTGTTNDHTLPSDPGRRCFRNDSICRVSAHVMAVQGAEGRLTTTWTESSLEGDSDDDEHDSDTDSSVVAGDTADDTDDEHEETHQGDTSKVKGSSTDPTDNCL